MVADGCRLCSSRMVNLSTAQITAMALITAGCHCGSQAGDRLGANGSANGQELFDQHPFGFIYTPMYGMYGYFRGKFSNKP